MRKRIIILIWAATGLFSCGQGSKSTPDTVNSATSNSTENVPSQIPFSQSQIPSTNQNRKSVDTKYEYTDSTGKSRLVIQNSLPKGGLKYTDSNGKVYVYAVFWTRIINQTTNPLELAIDFPADSDELPSSPSRYFKILLPPDNMTLVNESLFNYGLAVKSFLDNGIHKTFSLKRIINPNDSNIFYVVLLFNQGVDGTVRTGFNLKDNKLYYRVNDKEIHCGKINLNNLILKQ